MLISTSISFILYKRLILVCLFSFSLCVKAMSWNPKTDRDGINIGGDKDERIHLGEHSAILARRDIDMTKTGVPWCNAFVVSPKRMMVSAHCVFNEFSFFMGRPHCLIAITNVYTWNPIDEKAVIHDVIKVYVHKDYDIFKHLGKINIAMVDFGPPLVKMHKPIAVEPATEEDIFIGIRGFSIQKMIKKMSGPIYLEKFYPITYNNEDKKTNPLLILPRAECTKYISKTVGFEPEPGDFLCVRKRNNVVNACIGDSSSYVITHFKLQGVVFRGANCSSANSTTVIANVKSMEQFIWSPEKYSMKVIPYHSTGNNLHLFDLRHIIDVLPLIYTFSRRI